MPTNNEKIIALLSDAIIAQFGDGAATNRLTKRMMQAKADNDYREVGDEIIKVYPLPIGNEILRLFGSNRRDADAHLKQCFKLGLRTAKFFSFILLSQLWEEVKNRHVVPTPDFLAQFKELHTPSFGIFAGLIRAIHQIFITNNIEPFTSHLENDVNWLKRFQRTLDAVVEKRNDYEKKNEEMDWEEVEDLVTSLLCQTAFLVRFNLISVSDILVKKSRLSQPSYVHAYRMLRSTNDYLLQDEIPYCEFCDDHTVLLLKALESPKPSLSLSPFIIDTKDNKIKGLKEGIYVYNSRNGSLKYEFIGDGGSISIGGGLPIYEQLSREFEDLTRVFTS